jgi:hypothetical protein
VTKFTPKKIEEPEEPARPSSAELRATIGPLADRLIPTAPIQAAAPLPQPKPEPSMMMSFKASKSFARMLAREAEAEGGIRRFVARLCKEAGYPVPDADLNGGSKKRRTYD